MSSDDSMLVPAVKLALSAMHCRAASLLKMDVLSRRSRLWDGDSILKRTARIPRVDIATLNSNSYNFKDR